MMKKLVYATLLLAAGSVVLISSCRKRCNTPDKKDCVCTLEYAPVCGSDNKTYGNACEAECNGIKSYKMGECTSN